MPKAPPAPPLIIGVAGGSGSGKTTVARAITAPLDLDAVLIDADAYYLDLITGAEYDLILHEYDARWDELEHASPTQTSSPAPRRTPTPTPEPTATATP